MKKLIGFVLTAAVVISPASPAFADRDRGDSRRSSRSSSSCTADLGVLTSTANLQAFCGSQGSPQAREDTRQSNRRSSCTADLGALSSTVKLQALCGGSGSTQKARQDRRRNSRRCTADLGVLTRAVSLQALCSGR